MTIRHRLRELERKQPVRETDRDSRAILKSYLDAIGARLVASGELEDRPDRSPSERLAAALQRGDAETAKAILSAAVGREVTV